ncbi:MAG: hypothetical protein V1853_01795 [bacterium]
MPESEKPRPLTPEERDRMEGIDENFHEAVKRGLTESWKVSLEKIEASAREKLDKPLSEEEKYWLKNDAKILLSRFKDLVDKEDDAISRLKFSLPFEGQIPKESYIQALDALFKSIDERRNAITQTMDKIGQLPQKAHSTRIELMEELIEQEETLINEVENFLKQDFS